MTQPILEIENLYLSSPGYRIDVYALNHISLHINRGETVGMAGESGFDESVTAMLTARLLPEGNYRIHQGRVSLLGEGALNASEKQIRQWRGTRVAMIFQESMTAPNPARRIGQQMVEVIRHHQASSRTDVCQEAAVLLEEMQIPDAPEVTKRFPPELSGDMRQHVMITLAFSYEPEFTIVDEPTTALGVTVQLQVLCLLKLKARASRIAVLFISYGMAVVSQLYDRSYVMYAGSVIESGPAQTVVQRPTHSYSIGLLKYAPEHGEPRALLPTIPGTVPNLICLFAGCASRKRCFATGPRCEEMPALSSQGDADQQSVYWCP